MKSKHALLPVILVSLSSNVALADFLATAFSYQGRLTSGTNVANGSYDFQFYLRDALAAGATVTGCTVHIATEELDEGPILAQREVGVEVGDTEESLQERIKQTERVLYPEVIRAVLMALEAGEHPESVSL